jgi:hypothetical protein
MEYVVTSGRSFEEVEALTVAALERQGIVVQQTFSLHSAVEGSSALWACSRSTSAASRR